MTILRSNADGHWKDDGYGEYFEYDYEKIASETGYTVEQVKSAGVSYCRKYPQKDHPQKTVSVTYFGKDVVPNQQPLFDICEGRVVIDMLGTAEVRTGKTLMPVVGVSTDGHGNAKITVEPKLPKADHNGQSYLGWAGSYEWQVLHRHPAAKGSLTAPGEIILCADPTYSRFAVWRYNMSDGGRYVGGYHGSYWAALKDYADRLEYEASCGVAYSYDPKEVL